MPSFFTSAPSGRKRKRGPDESNRPTEKKKAPKGRIVQNGSLAAKRRRDDSISGSDSESSQGLEIDSDDESGSSSSSGEDENEAEKRLRLAQQYLDNLKNEVGEEGGFDAEDLDRDIIAERLKEDVGESKGRLYRRIADNLRFEYAPHTRFRDDQNTVTSITANSSFAYSVDKSAKLTKWRIPAPIADSTPLESTGDRQKRPKKPRPLRMRLEKVLSVKGNRDGHQQESFQGHTGKILCVKISDDGKFLVTGGVDKRLVVWDPENLKVLKVFNHHRDAITGIAFRRGTNQLFSCSKDRTVKVWSLDELAYIETLFGHQDEILDVAALALEHCVSVGARDRTARLWKVTDETQLVFRGGGGEKKKKGLSDEKWYSEGSMERVAMIDEDNFVTGSDNGSISLWNVHKKKPIFTVPTAHGVDKQLTEDEYGKYETEGQPFLPEPQGRWITALKTIPYSDVVISGSWDGFLRVWKVSDDKKKLEPLGQIGVPLSQSLVTTEPDTQNTNGASIPKHSESGICRGVVNDISIFERGARGQDGVCIIAAVGAEHRLGRWKAPDGKNGGVVFEIGLKSSMQSRLTMAGSNQANGKA